MNFWTRLPQDRALRRAGSRRPQTAGHWRAIGERRDDGGHFAEPRLPELLDDPLVRLLMASDGVDPRWLSGFLVEIANCRANGP